MKVAGILLPGTNISEVIKRALRVDKVATGEAPPGQGTLEWGSLWLEKLLPSAKWRSLGKRCGRNCTAVMAQKCRKKFAKILLP
jgi:hypothetical protein